MSKRAYRLYEERDGNLYPTQHKAGTPVPIGEWMEADTKTARDGSGERWYRVGFHSVPTVEDALRYKENFSEARRERLRLAEVEVEECWPKAHSPAPITLSRYMRVLGILKEDTCSISTN